ncbi:conserved hypothetical protein [Hyphomicrobiales bacterium]|jgi:hypothetical protein|nr:conserved hypothetical protein [Hyphomicrobiales bacterium]CAH1690383.1 conserved hypothetical protein [Hyphomicrobiales bacterium]
MRIWAKASQEARLGGRLATLAKLLQTIRHKRDGYKPERHYMRGPGPKALAKGRAQSAP